jgi:hypothetical protein
MNNGPDGPAHRRQHTRTRSRLPGHFLRRLHLKTEEPKLSIAQTLPRCDTHFLLGKYLRLSPHNHPQIRQKTQLFDLKAFEKLQIADLSDQLCAAYPVRFLERHHRTKKEIGLAQSLTRSNRGSLCCCTIVCFLRVNLSK